jgi:ATP-dependent DNA ligase
VKKLAADIPAQYFVFDLLARDGESLAANPLEVRRPSL